MNIKWKKLDFYTKEKNKEWRLIEKQTNCIIKRGKILTQSYERKL